MNGASDAVAARRAVASSSCPLYALDLQRKQAPLTPELTGSSFRLQTDTAAYGDTVAGTFTVDNRGGADAGAFAVQVVLSADNWFGPQSQVLTTFALAGLRAGREFSPGVFTVRGRPRYVRWATMEHRWNRQLPYG